MVWDPFEEMRRIQQEMDRLFSDFWGKTRPMLASAQKEMQRFVRTPITDVYEKDDSIIAKFELPGIEKRDIDLNVTSDSVEVKVDKSSQAREEKKGHYRYESLSNSFYRKIPLPAEVFADSTEAVFKDGVLTVTVDKATKRSESRNKIQVK